MAPTDAFKELTPGHDYGGSMEILSGIQVTDSVILNPADSLTSGARVQIAPASLRFVIRPIQPYLPSTHNSADFALPFDLSYEVDMWGRVRRTVSAAREEAQATAGDLQTVNLSLHADLALDYFDSYNVVPCRKDRYQYGSRSGESAATFGR
jgi:hypothetical protein